MILFKVFFAENNTSHFRWMEVHVCPVVHDFLSFSAGSGVNSPGFRGRSIWVCSTAQGNYCRGQTEGSAGNNDTEQIMTQYNTVAWKWLSYHQGYHMSGNIMTAIWKTSTPPSGQTHSQKSHVAPVQRCNRTLMATRPRPVVFVFGTS